MNHDKRIANDPSGHNDAEGTRNIEKIGEEEIPLDDRVTWKLFCDGPNETRKSIGYPFSSTEAMNALEQFRPSNIDELAAFIALYRPGPIEECLFDEFIRRKETGDWSKTGDAETDRILSPTFGMVLYADDVEVIQGFSGMVKHLFRSRRKAYDAASFCYARGYAWRHNCDWFRELADDCN